jgi:2-polyprenyl-3-methyl-5-hydroxy-6-metoxy-1,4-benzoquinol methylase
MNITERTSWKDIWEKKGQVSLDEIDLQQLIAIDGFDTGTGEFPVDSWLSFVETIRERLNINEGQKLLEVGCGAGAFMLPM